VAVVRIIRITLCLSLILAQLPQAGAAPPKFKAQTFEDWVPIENRGGTVYYARKADYEKAVAALEAGSADDIQRVPLYSFQYGSKKKNEAVPVLGVTVSKHTSSLKIYPKKVGGRYPMALCPIGKTCANDGTDISANVCAKRPDRCDDNVSVKWPKDQALSIRLDGSDGTILGDPNKTLSRLTPKDRWLLSAMRSSSDQGNARANELLLEWSKKGEVDSKGLAKLFSEEGTFGYLSTPETDFKVVMSGKPDAKRPDFLKSLNPLERAYFDTMMDPAAREAFLKVANHEGLTKEKAKELVGMIRRQSATSLEGGKTPKAKVQLAALQKQFGSAYGLDDESVTALLKRIDGGAGGPGLGKDKTGNLTVDGTTGDKEDPAGLPSDEFKHKDKRKIAGTAVEAAPNKQLEAAPKQAGMVAGLGKLAKNKWVMGGGGAVAGALFGFMMMGPFGAVAGAMFGGIMGLGMSMAAENHLGGGEET
jgi:hypothetical protein